MMGDYGTSGGWGWGSWLLMSLMMLVILALVAWGLFLIWRDSAARSVDRQPQPTSGRPRPFWESDSRAARSRPRSTGSA